MIDYDKIVVGRQIAFYRQQKHLTQKQLAEAVGMSVSYLSEIECGSGSENSSISMKNICNIAEVLEVPLDVLADTNIEYPGGKFPVLNAILNELPSLTPGQLELYDKLISIIVK